VDVAREYTYREDFPRPRAEFSRNLWTPQEVLDWFARLAPKPLGGPQLLRAALPAGVVGELDLTIAAALAGSGIRLVGDALLPELVRLRLTQVSRRRASCSAAAHLRRLIAGTAMTAIRPAGALPA
jgi:hypothetical protein